MSEEGTDFRRSHVARMPLLMKKNVTLDPAEIRVLRAYAVMANANCITNLIEQAGTAGHVSHSNLLV
jgi:hypothetical protein